VSTKNAPANPSQEPLEKQAERLERVARFAAELAAALRTEFSYYWLHPERKASVAGAPEFVARVDRLRALSATFLRDLRVVQLTAPAQAIATFRRLDRAVLFTAMEGLEAKARSLREIGRQRQWGSHGLDRVAPIAAQLRRMAPATPAPVPQPAAPRTLTDRLKGWLDAREAPPEAAPPPPSIGERRRKAFEGALALVLAMRKDLAGPMAILQAALAGAADAREDVVAELAALPAARRAAEVALTQYRQLEQVLPAYQQALAAAQAAPADDVSRLLQGHDLGRLKGVLLPLANLHASFRGYPVTGALFPPPAVVRVRASIPTEDAPAKPTKPAEPAPEAPSPAPPPPPPPMDAKERSRRRQSLLAGYMKDPNDRSVLPDNATVMRLVAEELAYQQDRELDTRMQLRLALNAAQPGEEPAARQGELERELADVRRRVANLAKLQRYVASQGLQ
jgi:hypothetical protein